MKNILRASIAAVAIASATPAFADVVLYSTPGAIQPEENVLLNTGATGASVIGTTNQTNTSVTFKSLSCSGPTTCTTPGETITAPSNGQARIEAADGSLDALRFFLTGGETFLEFEFNLFNGIDALQSVTIFGVTGGLGGAAWSQTFNLDNNGENYFAGQAINGQLFTAVAFNASGTGAADVRQIRIGGIGVSPPAVPEPSTWAMMLMGFGAAGYSMRRRRRQNVELAQLA